MEKLIGGPFPPLPFDFFFFSLARRGMLASVHLVLLVSCVHQQLLGAAGARCEAYSMELDAARLDPCSSFVVRGRGCFANSLQVDNHSV